MFLFWWSFGGVEPLECASGQGREEEPCEARWQQVAGDGPGHEEGYSWRVVCISYETQGVEDAPGREDARGVYDEREDAGDQTCQQRQGDAEGEPGT